jgi:hypothetical protein
MLSSFSPQAALELIVDRLVRTALQYLKRRDDYLQLQGVRSGKDRLVKVLALLPGCSLKHIRASVTLKFTGFPRLPLWGEPLSEKY